MTSIVGRKFVINNTNAPAIRPILIIFSGESNSGGEAPITTVPSQYQSPFTFPDCQILNNNSLVFQNLQMGVNNLIGHFGITDNTTFGWELELAIRVTATPSTLHGPPIYLVKTGQGGSTIGQWAVGDISGYYSTFLTRVNIAIALLTNPIIIMLWSQGLNEGSTSGAAMTAWEIATKAFFAQVRSDLSYQLPIIVPKFTYPWMNGQIFNTYYQDIVSTDSRVFLVETLGAGELNANHWSMVDGIVGDSLVNKILGIIK